VKDLDAISRKILSVILRELDVKRIST
jgi:Ca2+-binding EF-hand superfamily protein